MSIDDKIIRAYLQEAHNRGGSYHMAMLMMAERILVLEECLMRAGAPFSECKILAKAMQEGRI